MKHHSNHNTLSTWTLLTVEVVICVSHPATSMAVDHLLKRTTSSLLQQATIETTSSSTIIHSSSHMTVKELPGTRSSNGLKVREECPMEMTRPATEEVQDKEDAAISSSIIAGVVAEAVVTKAEDCSTRILCKLVCRIQGETGATSSKLGQWTSSKTSNTGRKITATVIVIKAISSNITTAATSKESRCAIVILPHTIISSNSSSSGHSTATIIRRRKAITRAMMSITTA